MSLNFQRRYITHFSRMIAIGLGHVLGYSMGEKFLLKNALGKMYSLNRILNKSLD